MRIDPYHISNSGATGSDVAYDATTWDGNLDVPTKNAVRDKIEAMALEVATADLPIATAAGTVDAITADYTPDVALTNLQMVAFVASGANTSTTPTFSPDGGTARTIVKQGGQALVAGDIPGALAVCILEYNLANTRWELLNPALGNSSASIIIASGAVSRALCFNGRIENYNQANDVIIGPLPTAEPGMNFIVAFGTAVAKYYRIDPANGDSIYYEGVSTGAGKYVGVAATAIGQMMQFFTIQTGASAWAWVVNPNFSGLVQEA